MFQRLSPNEGSACCDVFARGILRAKNEAKFKAEEEARAKLKAEKDAQILAKRNFDALKLVEKVPKLVKCKPVSRKLD